MGGAERLHPFTLLLPAQLCHSYHNTERDSAQMHTERVVMRKLLNDELTDLWSIIQS